MRYFNKKEKKASSAPHTLSVLLDFARRIKLLFELRRELHSRKSLAVAAILLTFIIFVYASVAGFGSDPVPKTAELVSLPISANYHETGFVTPASCGVQVCNEAHPDRCDIVVRDYPHPDDPCAPAPPTGSISANPERCQIPAGAIACTSRLSWSTTNAPAAEVWVTGPTVPNGARFSTAPISPGQDAPWINTAPHTFILFADPSRTIILDQVIVIGNPPVTPALPDLFPRNLSVQ